MRRSWQLLLSLLSLLTLSALPAVTSFAASSNQPKEEITAVKRLFKKYDALTDRNKFIVGASTGFIGARLILGSAMKVLRVTSAVFIFTEVLHLTGMTKDLPTMSEEQRFFIQKIRGTILRNVESIHVQIKRRLDPTKVQKLYEAERMVALGFASGALAGVMV